MHHPAMTAAFLVCPLCAGSFDIQGGAWRCTEGHAFDVAREGYVNLLPAHHKHSKDPGDRPDSLQARRAFLDAGHYAPLRSAIVERLSALRPSNLLDIGCGEGYYTAAMADQASATVGLDIAKPAIRLAAKRYSGITWVVGSGARLPVASESVDMVCTLFTPLHEAEMARVLRPGGRVLMVTPEAAHLHDLRAALFDVVEPHEPDKFRKGFEPMFDPAGQQTVRYPLALPAPDVKWLLEMTPYAWKARPERRVALEAREDGLQTEAAFSILEFTKRPTPAPAR
jgi:23S rRNA (guanine745-N1)-methyltransferase